MSFSLYIFAHPFPCLTPSFLIVPVTYLKSNKKFTTDLDFPLLRSVFSNKTATLYIAITIFDNRFVQNRFSKGVSFMCLQQRLYVFFRKISKIPSMARTNWRKYKLRGTVFI